MNVPKYLKLTIVRESAKVCKRNKHVQNTDELSKFVQAAHVVTNFTQKLRHHTAFSGEKISDAKAFLHYV